MDVVKICGVVLAAALFALILKGIGSDIRFAVIAGTLIVICAMCIPKISEIVNFAIDISNGSSISEYIPVVLKITAVALICELCSDICASCDAAALGKIALAAGKLEIIIIAFPLFRQLYQTAVELCDAV
ncbi:MAG: hypothetical protein IKN38_04960 [Clostridia bacterium]|nr:hypothetical protein [Clostridia bacterium]